MREMTNRSISMLELKGDWEMPSTSLINCVKHTFKIEVISDIDRKCTACNVPMTNSRDGSHNLLGGSPKMCLGSD